MLKQVKNYLKQVFFYLKEEFIFCCVHINQKVYFNPISHGDGQFVPPLQTFFIDIKNTGLSNWGLFDFNLD